MKRTKGRIPLGHGWTMLAIVSLAFGTIYGEHRISLHVTPYHRL